MFNFLQFCPTNTIFFKHDHWCSEKWPGIYESGKCCSTCFSIYTKGHYPRGASSVRGLTLDMCYCSSTKRFFCSMLAAFQHNWPHVWVTMWSWLTDITILLPGSKCETPMRNLVEKETYNRLITFWQKHDLTIEIRGSSYIVWLFHPSAVGTQRFLYRSLVIAYHCDHIYFRNKINIQKGWDTDRPFIVC